MSSRFVILTSLALGALLVGCGEPEVIKVDTSIVPVEPDADGDTPTDIAAPEEEDVWAEHRGDIPWVLGAEAGFARANAEKKPILFFYTATW